MTPSSAAVATVFPFGAMATDEMGAPWPVSGRISLPSATSQTRTMLSPSQRLAPALTSFVPSGENRSDVGKWELSQASARSFLPLSTSQRSIRPTSRNVARIFPLGEKLAKMSVDHPQGLLVLVC